MTNQQPAERCKYVFDSTGNRCQREEHGNKGGHVWTADGEWEPQRMKHTSCVNHWALICRECRDAVLANAKPPAEALVDARERGYDDARSFDLPSTSDLEGDFRRWRELNPQADLRSAWIAGIANERNALATLNAFGTQTCPICGFAEPHRHDPFTNT